VPAAHRIIAEVDRALQFFGLLSRCRHRPIRIGSDGEATLAAIDPVVQDERFGSKRGDADAEPPDLRVMVIRLLAGGGGRDRTSLSVNFCAIAFVRIMSVLRLRVAVGPVSLNVGLCQPISLYKRADLSDTRSQVREYQ